MRIPPFTEALKREVKPLGLNLRMVEDAVGAGVLRASRPSKRFLLRLMEWLYAKGLDTERVMACAYAAAGFMPLSILRSERSRYRVAAFAIRLWIEEQETRAEERTE
jgi:hypothetical protein